MRRREFIGLLAGAAAWPANAAEERERRLGVLLPAASNDPEFVSWLQVFLNELHQLGWATDRNIRVDTRWATANAAEIRKAAAELAATRPDLILAYGASTVGPLLQATRTIPIVFPIVLDPVAAGFVDSLARPGGNATGFMTWEYSTSGKWLELLKQTAPHLSRVGVLRDTTVGSGTTQFAAIQAMALLLNVEVQPLSVRYPNEIEGAITAFASGPGGGLIVTAGGGTIVHRDLIIALAKRHKLPSIWYDRSQAAAGGLLSYGPNYADQFRRSAHYVDRILHGERPGDMPVQKPTKHELVINVKTAKVLGLNIPESLISAADEVIE